MRAFVVSSCEIRGCLRTNLMKNKCYSLKMHCTAGWSVGGAASVESGKYMVKTFVFQVCTRVYGKANSLTVSFANRDPGQRPRSV